MPKLTKRNKTYRHIAEIADLVEHTSRLLDISESEIIEACILTSLEPAMKRLVAKRLILQRALREPAVAKAFASFIKAVKQAKQ